MLPEEARIRGYIVGDAVYQTNGSQFTINELRGFASRLGIAHRVGFTGFVDNTAAAMRALDVVVHASTQPEPFGLVIAEAMACGRAVIVSDGGGAGQIASAGANCVTHPPGDATALAQRIAELAGRKKSRTRLEVAARITAESSFDRIRLATDLIPHLPGIQPELTARCAFYTFTVVTCMAASRSCWQL